MYLNIALFSVTIPIILKFASQNVQELTKVALHSIQ